jgi:hypothetical protein
MPGVSRVRSQTGPLPQSFPGGNAFYAQHFVKWLVPDGYSGAPGLEGVHNGRVDFAALDRKGQATRIRLGATVFRVEHATSPADGEHVVVAYEQGGKAFRVKARGVVMASGGGMSRAVLADMPAEMKAAYATFQHAPALVVNVALDNWRFLHKLGAPVRPVVRRRVRILVQYPEADDHGQAAGADDTERPGRAHLLYRPAERGQAAGRTVVARPQTTARDKLRGFRASDSRADDHDVRAVRL